MAEWKYNNGPDFMHRGTGQMVPTHSWYQIGVEETVQAVNDVVPDGSTDMFKCPYCDKEYKTESGLNNHIERCPEKVKDNDNDQ